MSAHVCPVVRLGEEHAIEGADKIIFFDIVGNGPVVSAKGQFKPGDLACFIPPETMVDTGIADFDFLKRNARKSDGWAKIKPVRLRGQLSVGILVSAMGKPEGTNLADQYRVKKLEDLEPVRVETSKEPRRINPIRKLWLKLTGRWVEPGSPPKGLWSGIPVYDINQLYKMPPNLFADGELMMVTEKLHGTNARYVIGKDGKLWCGSRTMWRLHDGGNVYSRAAVQGSLESKLRRLAEPLVLWGEIVGPNIQRGFSYGLGEGDLKFYAFDFYHATERRFLDPTETKDICHWLKIDYVPIIAIDEWKQVKQDLNMYAAQASSIRGEFDHPREGVVVRPWKDVKESHALDGSKCLLAGKVINPAYLEFREKPGMDEQVML